jgi:nitrite reductase/ring-hydroxylating ferredoxin subunit
MMKFAEARQSSSVEICSADQLWDGEMECFRAGGTSVLLCRINGQFHAFQGHCPHQGAALVEGELNGGVLVCAAHQWQFDATNGQGVNPRSARLKSFPVRVVERKVMVEVGPNEVLEPEPQPHGDGQNERRGS